MRRKMPRPEARRGFTRARCALQPGGGVAGVVMPRDNFTPDGRHPVGLAWVKPRSGTSQVSVFKQGLLELVRALCVVALVFFNFGQNAMAFAPPRAVAHARFALPDGTMPVFCGPSGPLNDPGQHETSPVCQIGAGFDLPTRPVAIEPLLIGAGYIVYAPINERIVTRPFAATTSPRAPPRA